MAAKRGRHRREVEPPDRKSLVISAMYCIVWILRFLWHHLNGSEPRE